MDKLIEAGFAVRCDKVWLAYKEAPYLGFLVSENGTRPQPAKTAALLEMVCEDMGTDPSAAARYAGMIGFYHKFVQDLHSLLSPFHELKQKGADAKHIMSSLRFKAAFAATKHLLANATALARPDYSKPFYVDVDMASSVGAGAILSQRANDDDPDSHVTLAFWSRRFSGEERRYGVRDQECLGLVDSLETWRQFVVGAHTIVRTDHKSLEWLLTTPHKDGTRVSGFALKLQGYTIDIQYVPGSLHVGPDCMSRGIPTGPSASQASGRGGERGVLDSRPSIEDRVYDAASLAVTSTTEKVEVDDDVRVWGLFLRYDAKGQLYFLTEQQDGTVALPSVHIEHDSAASRRSQLSNRLFQTYENADGLVQALRGAFRCRLSIPGRPWLFVATLAWEEQSHSTTDCAFTASYQLADLVNLRRLTSATDRGIASYFARHYVLAHPADRMSRERRLLVRELSRRRDAATSPPASTNTVSTADSPPLLSQNPSGPALISTPEDEAIASERVSRQLDMMPFPYISIDLEGPRLGSTGHISCLQLCVPAIAHEPALVYVYDILACGHVALGRDGEHTLRRILSDPRVVKIFHSCYGDTAALHRGHGISTRGIFDTSVADSVCLGRPANKQRGLGTVLRAWLGEAQVKLTYKDTLVHTETFWDIRPLENYKFIYAYEDVTYCGELYQHLRQQLSLDGTLELVFALSQQRSPPVTLPSRHPDHRGPSRVAVALVDSHEQLVCFQCPSTGEYFLPHADVPRGLEEPSLLKDFAKAAWADCMGHPPKLLRASINNRMRKGVRVGDTMLYVCCTPDCGEALSALAGSRVAASRFPEARVIYRRQYSPTDPGLGVQREQATLFQYLHHECACTHARASLLTEVKTVGGYFDCMRVSTHLGWRAGRISLSLSIAHLSPPATVEAAAAEVFNAAPRADGLLRAAVLLYDSRHVFVLTTAKSQQYELPSHSIEEDTTLAESAAKAFDTFAGVALRKRVGLHAQASRLLMPVANHFVRVAEANSRDVGVFGNVSYHAWDASTIDGSTMADHLAAFHASRRMVNGFQMNRTKEIRNPSFALLTHEQAARSLVDQADRDALAAALASSGAVSQHSDSTDSLPLADAFTAQAYVVDWSSAADNQRAVPQHSEVTMETNDEQQTQDTCTSVIKPREVSFEPEVAEEESVHLPDPCTDAESHSLITAAATLIAALLSVTATESFAAKPAPSPLVRTEILDAQLAHPGTLQFIEYLRSGPSPSDGSDLARRASKMVLAEDGLLLWNDDRFPRAKRIVLPPALRQRALEIYHDQNGHLGLNKAFPQLCRRFFWDSDDAMRKDLAYHVRTCECRRAHIPHHRAGTFQVGFNGEHPNDVLSGDVYDVGILYDGYSHTLDFVSIIPRGYVSVY